MLCTAEKVSVFGAKPVRSAPRGTTRLSLPLKGEGSLSGFVLPTEILRLRYRLSVFLSRRKKNSEKERPLRGLRREVRFIVSPPGKRRHNELNAAPPPETPRRTGKPGAVTDRDNVHSGKSCRVRAKPVLHYFFFSSTLLCFCSSAVNPFGINCTERRRSPIFSPPRRLHCPRPATA